MRCQRGGGGGGGGTCSSLKALTGGLRVSEFAMQHVPVELEQKHAGGRMRCGVQRGHRGGSSGGGSSGGGEDKDAE